MYGPSGCGKSSLVKAGLLPRLDVHVVAVYVEAAAADTEARLLKRLRKVCPALPHELSLVETLTALRRGEMLPAGKKVLIVIDQFEQWLHTHGGGTDTELVEALRQCDVGHVQSILLVRDDFGMAATRFMDLLEIPILQGENFATVDRFDLDHARRVLTAIGRAYGRLPTTELLPTEQEQFLQTVVDNLAEDGRVICVRLALFAEMMKDRPWTPATLKEVGGLEGLGLVFLEQSVGERAINPKHRRHHKAARNVLQALLPELRSDIKGHMRSRDELSELSGYADRPGDFDELMSVLDRELRLVTPTELEGEELEEPSAVPGHYQLTHDYLVPPLREWLTRKQKETWRGRAELRLAERTNQWSGTRERRFLPSLPEYLSILCGVPRRKRTPQQRDMMWAATRHHARRWGTLLSLILVLGFAVERYVAASRAENRRQSAIDRVEILLKAPPAEVRYAIRDLGELRDLAVPILKAKFASQEITKSQRLHVAFGLIALGQVDDRYVNEVVSQVADVSPAEYSNVKAALRTAGETAKQKLAARTKMAAEAKEYKLQGRLAMLLLDLGDESAAVQCCTSPVDPETHMIDPASRTTFIHHVFPSWHGEASRLAEVLGGTQSSALRAALCLGVGLTPHERLADNERKTLTPVLLDRYRKAADAATHSAAGWTLRQWKVPLPDLESAGKWDRHRGWFVNSLGATLLKMPAGKFTMGSDRGFRIEKPVHKVNLTKPFWLSDREVTVDQFKQFVNDALYFEDYPEERPFGWEEAFKKHESRSPGGGFPVHSVSWNDAVSFCNWLSRREGLMPCYWTDGKERTRIPERTGYHLPSEAQWEYACRAGSASDFCFGDDRSLLDSYAVYRSFRTEQVGSKLPNAWGLFDTHGNVYEWVQDWFDLLQAPPPRRSLRSQQGPRPRVAGRLVRLWCQGRACRQPYRQPTGRPRQPLRFPFGEDLRLSRFTANLNMWLNAYMPGTKEPEDW